MSASHEYTERHLTPGGWIEGSSRVDPGRIDKREPPGDRFLTVVWTEKCNGYGPVHGSVSTTWRSEDAAAIARLIEQYGEAPRSL